VRTLTIPGLDFLDRGDDPEFRTQEWLAARQPALAGLTFTLTQDQQLADFVDALTDIDGRPYQYTLGTWIHRCARKFNLRPQVLITRWILEQGGVRAAPPFDLTLGIVRREPTDEDKLESGKPVDWQPGRTWSIYHDAGGPLLVQGDQVMFAALGFGIPDPSHHVGWNLECYTPVKTEGLNSGEQTFCALGFAAQIALGAWFLRRQLDRFKAGTVEVLYKGDSYDPNGERVICGDHHTFAALQYCPSIASANLWANVYRHEFMS
jgi:hypothetical protein